MKFTSVEEATYWLLNQVNPIPRPDMTKMYQALDYVQNPHQHLPVIHITGTNGKGSTVAYLRDLLMSQGFSVGSFTSPHIERFNERITFNHQEIPDEDLIRLTNRLVDLNDYMEKNSEYGRLIYFELFTIMACLYFQEKQPDICLIEAGIGGMHDCTNVLEGQVAIITSIAMDHADMLGETLEEIALEKAGIIKDGRPVVTGLIQASPLAVIDKWAQDHHAKHYQWDRDYGVQMVQETSPLGSRFIMRSAHFIDQDLQVTIGMMGDHQIHNATTSLEAFIVWMSLEDRVINWPKAISSLASTHWIGRLEKIHAQPAIYLDGAHNMEGLMALKQVATENLKDYQITLLYGGLKKKNQKEQIPLLLSFPVEEVYLTSFNHFEAMGQKDFEEILAQEGLAGSRPVSYLPDWQTFLMDYIRDHQDQKQDLLLITGSLYFVSEARAFLKQNKQTAQ